MKILVTSARLPHALGVIRKFGEQGHRVSHVFAFRHRMHVRKHKHSHLMEAQFFDIDWDGGAIE